MYEKITPVSLKASASSLFNNLDILPATKNSQGESISNSASFTNASYLSVHKYDVIITQQENARFDYRQIAAKERSSQHNTFLMDAKWCRLKTQTVLVMAHVRGLQIFDEPGNLLLFWHSTLERGVLSEGKDAYCRGISSLGNYILVGTCTGEILVIETVETNTFNVAETVRAHRRPIATIATKSNHSGDGKVNVASADDEGSIALWKMDSNGKLRVTSQIPGPTSKFPCTALCFLTDNLLAASYYTGHIRIFDVKTQRIKVEIAAHGAPINSMDSVTVGNHSTLISGGEDTFVRIWKITTKPKLEVTQEWFTSVKDLLICGVKFHSSDELFGVTGYDSNEVTLFRKKT